MKGVCARCGWDPEEAPHEAADTEGRWWTWCDPCARYVPSGDHA